MTDNLVPLPVRTPQGLEGGSPPAIDRGDDRYPGPPRLCRDHLADVAKTAGLSGGIVNFHFESKEKLLVETLRSLAAEYRTNGAAPSPWPATARPSGSRRPVAPTSTTWSAPRASLPPGAPSGPRPSAARPISSIAAPMTRNIRRPSPASSARSSPRASIPMMPARIARGLEAMMEGIWLDMMTMQSPITREEGVKTVFASLAAFFPQHFTAEGARVARMSNEAAGDGGSSYALPAAAEHWARRVRAFVVEELVPYEVHAELNQGGLPDGVAQHHRAPCHGARPVAHRRAAPARRPRPSDARPGRRSPRDRPGHQRPLAGAIPRRRPGCSRPSTPASSTATSCR